MANKRFITLALVAIALTLIVSAGGALVRVRAQIATIQPFVAIMVEEMAPRQDQPPTPITRLQTIAVRSDGSICRVSRMEVRLPVRFLYWREVIDATTRTHVAVEDCTRTIVQDQYYDIQVLKPGVVCDGEPAGQIEGFTVVYSEHAVGPADEVQVIIKSGRHRNWVVIRS